MDDFFRSFLFAAALVAIVTAFVLFGVTKTAFGGIGGREVMRLEGLVTKAKSRLIAQQENIDAIEAETAEILAEHKENGVMARQVATLQATHDDLSKRVEAERKRRTSIIAFYGANHRKKRESVIGEKFDKLTFENDKSITDAELMKIDDDRITFRWPNGMKTVSYDLLPSELRSKTGYVAKLDTLLREIENRTEEPEPVVVARRTNSPKPRTVRPVQQKPVINSMNAARISRLKRTNLLIDQRIETTRARIELLKSSIQRADSNHSYARSSGKISGHSAVATRKENEIRALLDWIERSRIAQAKNSREIDMLSGGSRP